MADYRCYLLDSAGAIRDLHVLQSPDDEAALRASRLVVAERGNCFDFELWERERCVRASPAIRLSRGIPKAR